jgi:hypothetical protein
MYSLFKVRSELSNLKYSLTNYNKLCTFQKTNFIYAPLFKVGKYNGFLYDPFFKYLIEILNFSGVKIKWWKSRPLPNKNKPRNHVSMWVEIDDSLIFFDKSDHIHELDTHALLICDKYFKDNYNKIQIIRLLTKLDMLDHYNKIKPFFSTCDVDKFFRISNTSQNKKIYDIAQIMSLYTSPNNIFNDDYKFKYRHAYDHGYIRYKTFNLLNDIKNLNIYINLSAKDKSWNYPSSSSYLNFSEYSNRLLSSNIGIVNTIPHRVFPWKVTEMISLGIPIAIDEKPITQFPKFFNIKPNFHFVEIFPGITNFSNDLNLDPNDITSYSALLNTHDENRFNNLFNIFIEKIKDKLFLHHLRNNIKTFRNDILLNKELIFDYIINS